jgi:hypothetical protein
MGKNLRNAFENGVDFPYRAIDLIVHDNAALASRDADRQTKA